MEGQFITSGYMCAKAENEMIISEELTCNHILGYMAKYAADLQKANANLGAWYNTEDGKTYLDTSYRFETLEEAIAFGKANNQLAIFDLNTFTEIRLSKEPRAPFFLQKINLFWYIIFISEYNNSVGSNYSYEIFLSLIL